MIYSISVVRNEQDIIEPFVRHNIKFVDIMFIMDNASVDATKSILKRLTEEFSNLAIVHDDRFMDIMETRNNSLLQLCGGADYVIPIDADEFITAKDRYELNSILSLIPSGGLGVTPWITAVTDIDLSDPPRCPKVRKGTLSKVIVNLPKGNPVGTHLFLGNHEAITCKKEYVVLPLSLLHVPVRSKEQIIGKNCVGWIAHLAFDKNVRDSGVNWHKQNIFDCISNNGLSDDVFSLISATYCEYNVGALLENPVVFDYERKYSTGNPMPAIPLIMKSWEQYILQ